MDGLAHHLRCAWPKSHAHTHTHTHFVARLEMRFIASDSTAEFRSKSGLRLNIKDEFMFGLKSGVRPDFGPKRLSKSGLRL